ncbi:MAG: hypothetical protein IJJ41_01485 [Clostridia bacterium]|nr:hypothetical protein [Clostridia bacterium]
MATEAIAKAAKEVAAKTAEVEKQKKAVEVSRNALKSNSTEMNAFRLKQSADKLSSLQKDATMARNKYDRLT